MPHNYAEVSAHRWASRFVAGGSTQQQCYLSNIGNCPQFEQYCQHVTHISQHAMGMVISEGPQSSRMWPVAYLIIQRTTRGQCSRALQCSTGLLWREVLQG